MSSSNGGPSFLSTASGDIEQGLGAPAAVSDSSQQPIEISSSFSFGSSEPSPNPALDIPKGNLQNRAAAALLTLAEWIPQALTLQLAHRLDLDGSPTVLDKEYSPNHDWIRSARQVVPRALSVTDAVEERAYLPPTLAVVQQAMSAAYLDRTMMMSSSPNNAAARHSLTRPSSATSEAAAAKTAVNAMRVSKSTTPTPSSHEVESLSVGGTYSATSSTSVGPILSSGSSVKLLALAKIKCDANAAINKIYNHSESVLAASLDILATYFMGQKIIYTESKTYCEQQLNALMLPAILISAICTVLSLALPSVFAAAFVMAGLTATSSFILAIISYLKLDAKAEAHKTSAYQFSKLQTSCEFFSGRLLFARAQQSRGEGDYISATDDNNSAQQTKSASVYQEVANFMVHSETKMKEIKDMNKFIIPESIRFRFCDIYMQNIFADVKKLEIEDQKKKIRLRACLKRIELERSTSTAGVSDELLRARDEVILEMIDHRHRYLELDQVCKNRVNSQIDKAHKRRSCLPCMRCNWLKT